MTITATVPLLSEPVADDLNTGTFAARARVNFLELNPALEGVNQVVEQINAESAAINAQAATAAANTTSATAAAGAAAISAAAAAATSTAANWVSGTTYAIGNVRRSLIDGLPYRRLTAGAGTVDPRDDKANWAVDYLEYDSGLPTIRPSLLLDFANSGAVDPRITVTRAGVASYYDAKGVLQWAPANTLRITHDPVTGERLGALIEPAATNSNTWSEDLSNAAYVKPGTTVTANAALAPDGQLAMDKVVEDTANSNHQINGVTASYASGVVVCGSVFAKAGERTSISLDLSNSAIWSGASNPNAVFDLASGVVTFVSANATAGIENCGNGVYRCWVASTTVAAGITQIVYYLRNGGLLGYAGDGVSGAHAWGFQLEAGVTRPTSYIKTTSTVVTRAADIAEIAGSNFSGFYSQPEGTLFAEYSSMGYTADPYQVALTVRNATITDYFSVGMYVKGDSTFRPITGDTASVRQATLVYGAIVPNGTLVKTAATYKLNGIRGVSSGLAVASDTSATPPVVDRMYIGSQGPSGQVNGVVRRVAYYPKSVSSNELLALVRP